jgi:protein SCO1/2
MMRAFLAALACAAAVVPGEALAHAPPPGLEAAKPPAAVRRAFDLVRHDGVAVTDRAFHGKPMLVFFGFTTCPDVCPTGLATMAKSVRQLEAAAIHVTPVFITVDPDRDTPALLAQYVKEFHPRMVGLTGAAQNVSHAAAAFGVQHGVTKNAQTYYVWHTSRTYLVGANGELLETFPPHASADTIAKGARRVLQPTRQSRR